MSTRRHDRSVRSGADEVAVGEIMSRDVHCVRPEMSIVALADLLVHRDVSWAPVTDVHGRVVGVVSDAELARATWDPRVIGRARAVADIMMPFPFVLPIGATVARAAALMAYEGVHRIVIVDAAGAVAGVLSGADVMRWLARGAGYAVPGGPHVDPDAPACLVMVVDDDSYAREELAELLREEGYAVVTAANGRDALHALRAGHRPALILLDLAMPVMDGGSFAAELRKDPTLGAPPVVLMSAQSSARAVAARVEARACLVKPVTFPALLDTVERFRAA